MMSKMNLTKKTKAPKMGTIESFTWGCPASAIKCGKEGWSKYTGVPCARRVSLHREVQGGLPRETAITLGARFYFASNIEKHTWRPLMPNPWYIPENPQDALDCLEDISTILAFLRDTAPQNPDLKPSEDGMTGFYFLLDFLTSATRRSVNHLAKRRTAL